LTVLEPTPTATVPPTDTPLPPPPTDTPTPTPTPTPNVVSFSVTGAENPGDVAPVPSQDDVPTYQVLAGTQVRLTWRVENPLTEVRLTDSQNDYGQRSPEDEFQLQVNQSTIFRLVVRGGGETPQTYERRIRVNVLPIPAPPPPFSVSGVDGPTEDDPATVTWAYPGESQSNILGFRVYRASIDNFNFARVADRFELDNTKTSWVDPVTPSCNWAYYVVAVYEDITRTGDDRIQETEASPTSWYTKPCSTP
jgi:hypothetical protein